MTYEGSSTRPGCEEGVTWVIMNRPIYASTLEMTQLRTLRQGEKTHPKSPVGSPNARPVQDVNGRTIRTNLVLAPRDEENEDGEEAFARSKKGRRKKRCPDLDKEMVYRPNDGWDQN